MNNRKNTGLILGALLFVLGALLGIALSAVSVWADLEANFYGFDTISDKQFSGLHCPVLMNRSENAVVTATFSNPSDTRVEPLIRADISSPGPFISDRTKISLEPGETKRVSWTVNSENIDMGDFVFLKVSQYPASILPAREAVCGIMVVNLPLLTGRQMFVFAVAISVLFMIAGLILLERTNVREFEKLPDFRRLRFFLALVLLAMLSSLTGRWLIGGMLLAVIVLAGASILGGLALQEK